MSARLQRTIVNLFDAHNVYQKTVDEGPQLASFCLSPSLESAINTAKAGATVPMKFNVYAGSIEQKSTSTVKSFSTTKISCDTSAATDEVDFTTTGGTSLRYDTTAGQFVQNWQRKQLDATA